LPAVLRERQAASEIETPEITMKKLLLPVLSACLFITATLSVCADADETTEPGLNEATFEGLEWRSIGPALMSGRVADIATDPEDRSTWHIAVGSGGVWKTVNRGTTWTPGRGAPAD
jgi:hypothetical protein